MLKTLKLMLSVLICCGTASLHAQTANVTGNLPGLKEKEIVIYYYKDGVSKADTVKVSDGKFKWVAKMPEPQKVGTMLSGQFYQSSTLLIDPQGKIVAKDLRGESLNKKLAELFN